MTVKKKKIDIILYSEHIKKALKKRLFEDLNLKYIDIITDAQKLKYKGIDKASLSRYFNSSTPVNGALSHQSVIFLCVRYGVNLMVKVGLNPYNEEQMIKKVKELF